MWKPGPRIFWARDPRDLGGNIYRRLPARRRVEQAFGIIIKNNCQIVRADIDDILVERTDKTPDVAGLLFAIQIRDNKCWLASVSSVHKTKRARKAPLKLSR